MRYINKITANARQRFVVIGEEGEEITINLRYMPSQRMWTLSLEYLDFILNGINMTVSPNILRNYNNILPFGIAITSVDGLDPMFINDFTSGRIRVFLLNRSDVDYIESQLFI